MSRELRTTLVLCAMQILALAGWLSFQALIPRFRSLWSLSNGEAGWIAAISYVSYACAAPLLVSLTDRIDARRVVAVCCTLSAIAAFGFAFWADGFWTGMLFRCLTGIGVAGSFMPGLKALSDRVTGARAGRYQSFYTASFSVGSALSLSATAFLAELSGWRGAFFGVGLLALGAALLVFLLLEPRTPAGASRRSLLFDPRPLYRDRTLLGYLVAYAAHAFEMAAFRTWIVSYLLFAAVRADTAMGATRAASLATLLVLAGLPASILGNEIASRFPREPTIALIMTLSGLFALLLGSAAGLPVPVVLAIALIYACLVMADSAAITVGVLARAPAERRGMAIASQTLVASVAAMTSPLLVGYALDWAGDGETTGWILAFAVMAAGILVGPLALLHFRPRA